jgi:hypothetical protein
MGTKTSEEELIDSIRKYGFCTKKYKNHTSSPPAQEVKEHVRGEDGPADDPSIKRLFEHDAAPADYKMVPRETIDPQITCSKCGSSNTTIVNLAWRCEDCWYTW